MAILSVHTAHDVAKKSGIKVPSSEELETYKDEDFPHFSFFCSYQIGKPLRYASEHWDNAKIVASLTHEQATTLTWEGLDSVGL